MKKRMGELIMSALFFVMGIAAIANIQMQDSSALNNTGATTFKSFPTVYGVMIAILSGLNFINTLRAALREREENADAAPKSSGEPVEDIAGARIVTLRVAGMFILTVIFALLLKKVHFALLVAVFLFASFFLFGRKKLVVNAVISAGGSIVIYIVFVILLKLPL